MPLPVVLRKLVRRFRPFAFLEPEGDAGIDKIGHRAYVGGLWDEIGQLQFDFLVGQGLRPEHRLLDVACGALRLGVKAIPYLQPGHYMGIDKEERLIALGLQQELGPELQARQRPQMLVNGAFEFERFGQPADFAIAQSLFSHFPPGLIEQCMHKLLPAMRPGGVFFATYFESAAPVDNPEVPHDHGYFAYTRAQMEAFGTRCGFNSRYIGDWQHPRQQVMVAYQRPPLAG